MDNTESVKNKSSAHHVTATQLPTEKLALDPLAK
jgi:hypothetical protein